MNGWRALNARCANIGAAEETTKVSHARRFEGWGVRMKKQRLSTMTQRVAVVLGVAPLLAMCSHGRPIQPQIFSLNYRVIDFDDQFDRPAGYPTREALLAVIESGQRDVDDFLSDDPCNFTASFAEPDPPDVVVNGRPERSGFNVTVNDVNAVNIAGTNPAGCPEVVEFQFQLGGPSELLDVGDTTNRTGLMITTAGTPPAVDPQWSTTNGFFEATLDTFERRAGYTVGELQVVAARTDTGSNTLLIAEGAYAVRP